MTDHQDDPGQPAGQLEPSDSPSAALEADLATVGDDEFFDALDELTGGGILGREADGTLHDPAMTVYDLRGNSPEQQAAERAELDRRGR